MVSHDGVMLVGFALGLVEQTEDFMVSHDGVMLVGFALGLVDHT